MTVKTCKVYYVPSAQEKGVVSQDEIVNAVRAKLGGKKNTRVYMDKDTAEASVRQNMKYCPNRYCYEVEVTIDADYGPIEVDGCDGDCEA